MAEVLLHTNRRAASVFCVAAFLTTSLGGLAIAWGRHIDHPIISWSGAILVLVGALGLRRQLPLLIPPRLALSRDHLLVYLRGFTPIRIPLDIVECFFIGQGPSPVPVAHPSGGRVENVTVVVRLAQRAQSWHKRSVDPSLGKWADGYITLQGLWCAPLDGDKVNAMNHQLAMAKRRATQISGKHIRK